jgi:hypothetical protein
MSKKREWLQQLRLGREMEKLAEDDYMWNNKDHQTCASL